MIMSLTHWFIMKTSQPEPWCLYSPRRVPFSRSEQASAISVVMFTEPHLDRIREQDKLTYYYRRDKLQIRVVRPPGVQYLSLAVADLYL